MGKILIIEDEDLIREELEILLSNEGYRVESAAEFHHVTDLVKSFCPDLILLDLMLPGQSGEKVLEKIQDIPVIVISAKVDIEDKVNVLLGGAADYLTKPFEIEELLARITVQLRRGKSSCLLYTSDAADD